MSDKKKRNDPCPCGSGKKFKKCCGVKKQLKARNTSVIDASSSKSLLDRINLGGDLLVSQKSGEKELKDRISKNLGEK